MAVAYSGVLIRCLCAAAVLAALPAAAAPPKRDRAVVVIDSAPARGAALGEEVEDVVIAAARGGLAAQGIKILGATTMSTTRGWVQLEKDIAAATRESRQKSIDAIAKQFNVEVAAVINIKAYDRHDGVPYGRIDVIAANGEVCASKALTGCGATWSDAFPRAQEVGRWLGSGKIGRTCAQLALADTEPTPVVSIAAGGKWFDAGRIVVERGTELVLDSCRSRDAEHDALLPTWVLLDGKTPIASHAGAQLRRVFDSAGVYHYRLDVLEEAHRSGTPRPQPIDVVVVEPAVADAGADKLIIQRLDDDDCFDRHAHGLASNPELPYADHVVARAEDCRLEPGTERASCWYVESSPGDALVTCDEDRSRCRIGPDNIDLYALVPGEYVLGLIVKTPLSQAVDKVRVLVTPAPQIYSEALLVVTTLAETVRARVVDVEDRSPLITYRAVRRERSLLDIAKLRVENVLHTGSARVSAMRHGLAALDVTASARRRFGDQEIRISSCRRIALIVTARPNRLSVMGGISTERGHAIQHVRASRVIVSALNMLGVSVEAARVGAATTERYYAGLAGMVNSPLSITGFSYDLRVGAAIDFEGDYGFLLGANFRFALGHHWAIAVDISTSKLGDGALFTTGISYAR